MTVPHNKSMRLTSSKLVRGWVSETMKAARCLLAMRAIQSSSTFSMARPNPSVTSADRSHAKNVRCFSRSCASSISSHRQDNSGVPQPLCCGTLASLPPSRLRSNTLSLLSIKRYQCPTCVSRGSIFGSLRTRHSKRSVFPTSSRPVSFGLFFHRSGLFHCVTV